MAELLALAIDAGGEAVGTLDRSGDFSRRVPSDPAMTHILRNVSGLRSLRGGQATCIGG